MEEEEELKQGWNEESNERHAWNGRREAAAHEKQLMKRQDTHVRARTHTHLQPCSQQSHTSGDAASQPFIEGTPAAPLLCAACSSVRSSLGSAGSRSVTSLGRLLEMSSACEVHERSTQSTEAHNTHTHAHMQEPHLLQRIVAHDLTIERQLQQGAQDEQALARLQAGVLSGALEQLCGFLCTHRVQQHCKE
eukprot:1160383-Pelagomonas_calceolata.AAC.4